MLLEVIGAGGMGTVWRARHRDSGDVVAVKLLRDGLAADQDLVLRFVQERQVMRTLRHPNIVTVRDFVVEGERLALVMDLVEGGDLRALIQRRGTLPPAEAAALLAQIAGALTAAHELGVVHRDVKPGNVLLDRATGQVRLTDFGVARILHGPGITQTSAVIGTPVYLAPEVADGDAATPAVDVYALGLILYELLAGRPPFVGEHPMVLIRQHAMAAPRRLPGMPDALWAIVSACVAKDPAARPAAAAVVAALRAAAPALAGLAALPPVARGEAPSVTSEPLGPQLPPAPTASGPSVPPPPAPTPTGLTGPTAAPPTGLTGPTAPSPGGLHPAGLHPAGPNPAGPGRRSRKRLVVLSAAGAALAVSAAAVAYVAPWSSPGTVTAQDPQPPLAAQSTPTTPATTPGTAKRDEHKDGTARQVREDINTEPADPPSTRPKKKTTTPEPARETEPVDSPKPRVTEEADEVKPDDGTKTDPPSRDTTPDWQCRPWISAGPGTRALMSPCIAVAGDTILVKGKLKQAAPGEWNIHVQLYNTEAERVTTQPYICKNASPAANGVAVCGPYEVDVPRTGQLQDVRQRWKPAGTLTWGGGRESPTVTW
ncbi:serine/threonine-protein kinase [Nonomuraea rhodomycinica]|uniref:non-specific serine/threonine protein kinase n=1 Tax=Nonomuraea rhodomycinica TaxID=1712872 RepID=A0A7Y6IT52_9ACTN|nr:serine/threonine-protein kinase [Nonomuraea rhodomycinica]NUW43931.1 protein kinase [Nonomuraea rhodomycinica]